MLGVIWAGVVVGASYALSGAAFTVAYRASRILNFALGGFGGVGAFVAVSLVDRHLPWAVSFILAVAVGAAIGIASEIVVGRRLIRISPLAATIGMLGVLLILQGIISYAWGTTGSALPSPLPGKHIRFGDALSIQAGDGIYVLIAAVACFGLLVFLYHTNYGLQMRAVSEGPVTAATLGIQVRLTGTVGWGISGGLGAAAAIFVGSIGTLLPSTYTSFIFLALIALVIGGLSSIWGVMLGGLVFGVALSVTQAELSTRLTYTIAFLLLCVLLMARPDGLLGRPETQLNEPSAQIARRPPLFGVMKRGFGRLESSALTLRARALTQRAKQLQEEYDARARKRPFGMITGRATTGCLLVMGLMVALWWIAPPEIAFSLPQVTSNFLAILGLDIMLGYCGQLNLAQGAFVAIGSYTGAIAVTHLDLPAWAAFPAGALGGALIGILIGLPAVRLSHLYYAQVTLLLAFVIPELILYFAGVTGGSTGLPMPALGIDGYFSIYVLYLGITAVAVVAVKLLLSSSVGRHWRGIRDNEGVAQSLGQRTYVTKLGAFAVGCGLAGLAGAMQGFSVGTIAPDSFPVWLSLYYQAATVVGGMTSMLGNLLASFFITVVPIYSGMGSRIPADLLFGAVLLLVMLLVPRGLGPVVTAAWRFVWCVPALVIGIRHDDRTEHEEHEEHDVTAAAPDLAKASGSPPAPTAHGRTRGPSPETVLLQGVDVRAGYRGSEVLHSVSFALPRGSIVGVLGPNGAGKSTLLRCVTGLLRPSSGHIEYENDDVTGMSAHLLARAGVAHVLEGRGIFPDLTVRENLQLGILHARKRNDSATGFASIESVQSLFPILAERQDQRAGTLSGGEQQMVAIARSLLMSPSCLVLDEPLLGLAPVVASTVVDALRQIRESGVTILLVEQSVHHVMDLCDFVYVLGSGSMVASGTPEELRTRDDLLESYFGLTNAAHS